MIQSLPHRLLVRQARLFTPTSVIPRTSTITSRPPTTSSTTTTTFHRLLSTTPFRSNSQAQAHANPIANPTARPDLLYRDPLRPLPTLSSLSPTRRWLRTLPIFLFLIAFSALGIFNYQKSSSPIITATLYSLRTNPKVREVLGDEVYFASKWAWVWGSINLVQGRVDVSFGVKGTRREGTCVFRARRLGGKGGSWRTEEWCLMLPEGERVELLEGARDPLEGAGY